MSKEAVNNPSHYGGKDNQFEHVKVAEALGWVSNAHIYNCTKYLWRLGKKDIAAPLEDLRKARWYLDRAIALEQVAEDARQEERRKREKQIDTGVTSTKSLDTILHSMWPKEPSTTLRNTKTEVPTEANCFACRIGDSCRNHPRADDLSTFGELPSSGDQADGKV